VIEKLCSTTVGGVLQVSVGQIARPVAERRNGPNRRQPSRSAIALAAVLRELDQQCRAGESLLKSADPGAVEDRPDELILRLEVPDIRPWLRPEQSAISRIEVAAGPRSAKGMSILAELR
jgi:hypothetical protein